MARPTYRPAQDRPPHETTRYEWQDGHQYRTTWRQVGWIGGSGAMYGLHEDTTGEPAGVSEMWIVASSDLVAKVVPATRDDVTGAAV